MKLLPKNTYHIYNRGNNKQIIFIEERNYTYLDKINKHICKYSDVLAYCLMPNHFHIMIHTRNNLQNMNLNNEIAIMLRSYTRAINVQENRTGSLFQQKTKAKNVGSYTNVCFNYIHQNPLNSMLTNKLEDWQFSSFNEYLGKSSHGICNIELGGKLIDFKSKEEFYSLSYNNIDKKLIDKLF